MNWLFRSSMLILLSVALALGAVVLVLWQRSPDPTAGPLQEGDREIVFLYSATSAATWERFVTAVNTAAKQLDADYPDLVVQVTERTFPPQTTAVPELALAMRGGRSRLVFRWYKLTSDQTTEQWVDRLVGGQRRPPLAIIGGAASDPAIDAALSLSRAASQYPETTPPLLILSTATADHTQREDVVAHMNEVEGRPSADRGIPLNRIYAHRTVRYCFTNQQMAAAVMSFIQSRSELRPDAGPVYLAIWMDDAYSRDLTGRFCELLRELPVVEYVDYSVGAFDQPNRWEAPVIERLLTVKRERHPDQQRPLLVLPAANQGPARRFLRGLVRSSPVEARRFVVATGDGISFNTVYRDRHVSWPIQDLPFDLIFFSHRNPVDARAGFRAEGERRPDQPGQGSPATGTDDLLLFSDMVKTLVHASYLGDEAPRTGDELRQRLAEARWKDGGVRFRTDGELLFDDDGHRRTGTGEHIVWLRPALQGEQVLPRATIQVWSWPSQRPKPELTLPVEYDSAPPAK